MYRGGKEKGKKGLYSAGKEVGISELYCIYYYIKCFEFGKMDLVSECCLLVEQNKK